MSRANDDTTRVRTGGGRRPSQAPGGKHLQRCGLIFMVLGVLAVAIPQAATLATELLIGWLLVLAGAGGLYLTWQARGVFTWGSTGLLFVLTFIAGLVLLLFPVAGTKTLTILLSALLLFEGAITIAVGLRRRNRGERPGSGWLIFNGASSILVAVLIVAGLPSTAAWAIGLLVGINLLTTGLSLFMLGAALSH